MRRRALHPLPLWAYLLAALVVLVIAVAAFVFAQRQAASTHHTQTEAESLIVRAATSTDHMIGNLSAPVQVIEYGDFSCQYCERFYESTLPQLQSRYGNKIVVVFRNLPLAEHPDSFLEAEAAECVSEIGGEQAYWTFVSDVFAQPDYDQGLDIDRLASLSSAIGVSGAKLRSCVQSGAPDARINEDSLEASVAGLNETPSFILKTPARSLVVAGDYPNQLEAGIDYLLNPTLSQ